MTQEQLSSRMATAIKQLGVGGYYIYFETPIELKDGRKINEVRLNNKKMNAVEFLECGTNKVITRISKKDQLRVYSRM